MVRGHGFEPLVESSAGNSSKVKVVKMNASTKLGLVLTRKGVITGIRPSGQAEKVGLNAGHVGWRVAAFIHPTWGRLSTVDDKLVVTRPEIEDALMLLKERNDKRFELTIVAPGTSSAAR